MEKTVEVTSIPFTDKEYVKALETLLNQSIDFIAEKLDEKLISEGFILLQNNLVVNFTGTRSKRKFFLYESDCEEQNPQNGIKFDKHIAKYLETPFIGIWPIEDQIKKFYDSYLFTLCHRANCTRARIFIYFVHYYEMINIIFNNMTYYRERYF